MIKRLYVETNAYNMVVWTDGELMTWLTDSNANNLETLQRAIDFNWEVIEGLDTVEDIAFELASGVAEYNEDGFENVTEF